MLRCSVGLLLLLIGPLVPLAGAQIQTGSISGVVRDQQGGVLPGATVTLIASIGNQRTMTERGGDYRFVALDPGTYAVQVELEGFQPVRQENIRLQLGQHLQINVALNLAQLAETVQVSGASPIVDTTSTTTTNTLSQDLLAAVPLVRTNAATQIMNYAPGINANSAFGGDASANALLLDGVDTRSPSGGGAYTFFNYNIVEEVQVSGLGAPAEMGGFTGAVINTVTKSGGNSFAGLFEVMGASGGMSSKNVSPEIARLNAALTDTAKITKLLDYTVQLGGPIEQNKVFFFTSTQRFYQDTDPSGAQTLRHEVSPRFNFKVTAVPSPNDNLMAMYQVDDYNILLADASGGVLSRQEDSPEFLTLAQWRHVFGARAFSEVKYTQWTGYADFDPVTNEPYRLDSATGQASGGFGQIDWGLRERRQLNSAFTQYADALGEHTLKFGLEIERSQVRDQRSFIGGATFEDVNGRPSLMFVGDFDRRATNRREAVYAQDSWAIHRRLTINPGVRADFIRGYSPTFDRTVYDTASVAPRFGLAWNVTGDDRSVVKASYGHYYETAISRAYARGVGGDDDSITYDITGPRPVEISRRVAPVYDIDPNIKHPRTDELSVSFERALRSDLRVAVTGIWRTWKNALNSVLPNARWTPISVTNPLTNSPMTAYRLTNPSQASSNLLITNTDGLPYFDADGRALGSINTQRDYRGLSLVLSKRFNRRYQFQASYVASRSKDSGSNALGGTAQFESANDGLVNKFGETGRPHEFKLLGSYQVPVAEVLVAGYYRLLSGTRYTPVFQLTNAQVNTVAAGLGATARQIFLEPRGSHLTPTQSILDFRVEKIVTLPDSSDISLFVDVQNLLNSAVVTSIQTRVPSTLITGFPDPVLYGSPSAISTARQASFGARWKFSASPVRGRAQQDPNDAGGGPGRFFTSRKGSVVLAVLGAGIGYGVYSKVHDRLHSNNPDR